MRLAGRIKGGFYPTPPVVLCGIARRLEAPTEVPPGSRWPQSKPYTIFDPCAGDGKPLKALRGGTYSWYCRTYGIELDGERRLELAKRSDNSLGGDAFQSVVGHGQASVLFLNPPYDVGAGSAATDGQIGKQERKEVAFLKRFEPTLTGGGVLVYVVPTSTLSEGVLRWLSRRFINMRVWRFPEKEYERFGQVVLMAQRRNGQTDPDDALVARLRAALLSPLDLEEMTEATAWGEPKYQMPSSESITPFRLAMVSGEEAMLMAAKSPLWGLVAAPSKALHKGLDELAVGGLPPIPLDGGMLALTVASGVIHGSVGTEASKHLIRGSVQRVMSKDVKETYNQDGERTGEIVTETFRYLPVVHTLDAEGVIRNLSTGAAVEGEVIEGDDDEAKAANG